MRAVPANGWIIRRMRGQVLALQIGHRISALRVTAHFLHTESLSSKVTLVVRGLYRSVRVRTSAYFDERSIRVRVEFRQALAVRYAYSTANIVSLGLFVGLVVASR
jgi:hypothetical protein